MKEKFPQKATEKPRQNANGETQPPHHRPDHALRINAVRTPEVASAHRGRRQSEEPTSGWVKRSWDRFFIQLVAVRLAFAVLFLSTRHRREQKKRNRNVNNTNAHQSFAGLLVHNQINLSLRPRLTQFIMVGVRLTSTRTRALARCLLSDN